MEQNVSTEKKSSEVIVVTSGKGGVGKTTTSANVGTGLAKAGCKVCLIDTDIGLRNLDVVMGLENRIVYNLVDVVEGNCRIKQALIRDKRHPGLYLMPSAQTRDKTAVTPGQMIKVIDHLREQFDYIILDCPAGIEQGFQNAIAGADRALVVTTPEVSAIRDADRWNAFLVTEAFVCTFYDRVYAAGKILRGEAVRSEDFGIFYDIFPADAYFQCAGGKCADVCHGIVFPDTGGTCGL